MTDVITRVRSFDDRYYLFIRFPRIEILEMNPNGKIENIFYKNNEGYDFIAKDFLIKENNEFELFYILSAYPKQTIGALYGRAFY